MHLPPLVTSNPTTYPTLANAGTVVRFGDGEVNEDARSGGRFTLGIWLDPCATRGIDMTYFGLGSQTTSYYADEGDFTRLGRPYFNTYTGLADAELIAYPGARTGWVAVSAETRFQGTEVLYRRAMKRCPGSQVDMLIGWRWLQLRDNLFISQDVETINPVVETELYDRFHTSNNFHGVEFGVEWERPWSCVWTFETIGKLASGNTYSVVKGDGAQTLGGDQGLLAMDSNSGIHKTASFASVVEIGLSLKRRFQCGLEATFGYSLVYWSDVMRAGDQVDLDVDPRQLTGSAQIHPVLPLNTTDFWAQGLHCGLEYAF